MLVLSQIIANPDATDNLIPRAALTSDSWAMIPLTGSAPAVGDYALVKLRENEDGSLHHGNKAGDDIEVIQTNMAAIRLKLGLPAIVERRTDVARLGYEILEKATEGKLTFPSTYRLGDMTLQKDRG